MMLQVENLHVYYGSIHAVKGISLHILEGEVVALVGANGAGKSTTLKALSGVKKAKEGRVSYLGDEATNRSSAWWVQRGVSHCPEGRQVFPEMSVMENLEMGAYTRRDASLREDYHRIFELFPRLEERRRQPAGTLSGGEQQMLALGRALISRPKLLLLDEPSLGLAPVLVQSIFEVIGDLRHQGMTILLVEQNAQLALKTADRAYVLETGELVLEGSGQELLKSDSIRKAYLGEV
jgi:branched-chain amino acid transport system ATP-binding protein